MPPIHGLSRVDHFGITVPDLDQAREFFEEVLGFEYLYRLGPLRDDTGHWMSEHLNVHDRAISPRIYFFRLGGQAILEVFEYQAPGQRLEPPLNSDVGGHHLALYVDDIDTAVADLRQRGIRVLGDPTESKGPHEGQRWVYFLSPWGLHCELVSYPNGKAYLRTPEAFS
ncbi:VOC family protein [Streptomyces sp. NPDC127036]|uniref:VOC family protein n=1 Tax=Streptomyces sp. NPDC127036 TaxID=3347112 RepID=UPI0036518A00